MKSFTRVNYYKLAIILFFSFNAHGQDNIITQENKKVDDAILEVIDSIKICKWKYDAQSCINFSFDDNLLSQTKISKIFDQYGFKSTYFIIPNSMYIDSLKDMAARGHEIGSHTYSHVSLGGIDSLEIDFQTRKSKEMIENCIGIKCLSFADPYHETTEMSKNIVFSYYSYARNYSKYINHSYYPLFSSSTLQQLTNYISKGISKGEILLIAGHGLEGDGYSPISEHFLREILNLVNDYNYNGVLWVTTIKEGIQYENLYHELMLEKKFTNDTLILSFKNFNKLKYKNEDKAMISIKIPFNSSFEITRVTQNIEKKMHDDKYIFTMDLKKDTSMVLIMKNSSPLTKNIIDEFKTTNLFTIYPNPIHKVLRIQDSRIMGNGEILSIEIFNTDGKLIQKQITNFSEIDVSRLKKGLYFVKKNMQIDSTIKVYMAKFLKF